VLRGASKDPEMRRFPIQLTKQRKRSGRVLVCKVGGGGAKPLMAPRIVEEIGSSCV
jgi:hypothetical protein